MAAPRPGDWFLIRRILRQGWDYKWMILLFLVATATSGALMGYLLSQLAPFISLLGQVTKGVPAQDAGRAITGDFTLLGLKLFACAVPAAGSAFLSWWAGQWVANRTMRHLRTRLLGHLVRLELSFHVKLNRGDLLTRLTTDLASTLRVQQYLYGKLLQRPFESLGILAVVYWLHPGLGLAVTAILVVVVAILVPLVRRTRRHSKTARETLASNVGVMEQITAGIKVIKTFGSSAREQDRYAEANRKLEADNMRLARTRAQSDAITAGAVFLIAGAALVVAGFVFTRTSVHPGHLFVAIGALARLITSVREVVRAWGDLQEQLPSAERVYALLDRESAVRDRPDARDCPPPAQAIRCTGVRFAYDSGSEEVLRGVDLDIPIGRTIALVGESGSGKSTLLDLLPRLHDVTAGAITVDGVDVRELRHDSLVHHFAIVGQDAFLFDDTVFNNIAYGRPGATREEVEAAARRAHVHEAIISLEGGLGYDTPAGDRGGRLSGGQRQRIAIARAFLRDAPVILLDEPTSALDADSEQHVQAALAELMQGRTVVIVAHRLATIQHADRIYVLAGKAGAEGGDHPARGTVLESGSHRELLERNGEYARLVRLQQLRS